MIRRVIFLLALISASSCGFARDEPFLIYNGCKGSWLHITEADGTVIVNRLDYGAPAVAPDLHAFSGQTVYFVAAGYEIGSNRPLGSATTSRHIPRLNSGTLTSPSELSPWRITSLTTSDKNGGCVE